MLIVYKNRNVNSLSDTQSFGDSTETFTTRVLVIRIGIERILFIAHFVHNVILHNNMFTLIFNKN